MPYKMKHPKGKGFPFKEEDSPLKHYSPYGLGHPHEEDTNEDGVINEEDIVNDYDYEEYHNVDVNDDGIIGDDDRETVDIGGSPGGLSEDGGGGNDLPAWTDRWTSGEPLIESSLDPDAETALGKAAREREESGAHRYARGGQPENPDEAEYPYPDLEFEQNEYDVEYPWGDDDSDGGNDGPPNYVDPGEADEIDDRPIDEIDEVIDYDPDGDGEANEEDDRPIDEIDTDTTTDTFGDEVSPANDRPDTTDITDTTITTDTFGDDVSVANDRPDATETTDTTTTTDTFGDNVSSAVDRPDTLETETVTTDIFGNEVSALDTRGRQQPFSTVTTPKKSEYGRKDNNKNTVKGKRGFKQPGWMSRYNKA